MNNLKNKWNYSKYSKINPLSKDYFPFQNPRKGQLETISEIIEAVSQGYKYIVLEAGTGTGKSAIASTLSSIFDSAYILTVTKQLQNQYKKDFDFNIIKGRSNYPCIKYFQDNIEESCEFGRCVLEDYDCEFKNTKCYYNCQKYSAINSNVLITNYAYAFYEFNNIKTDFYKRDILICDEAHNLEKQLMNLLTLELKINEIKEDINYKLQKDNILDLLYGDYFTWINFLKEIRTEYEVKKTLTENVNSIQIKKNLELLKNKIFDLNDIILLMEDDPSNWVIDFKDKDKTLLFKPLNIDKYANHYLFRHGNVCLFMSATILDYHKFCELLGIDYREVYAIRRKSPFNSKRNPIKHYSEVDLSYNNISNNIPKSIPIIKDILNKHKNDKGIIHTVSYSCKEYLMDNISDTRLIDHETYNRGEILEKFEKTSNPMVLVSPSMNEGVDLPYDNCRFQIILKIPYLNYSDKQVLLRTQIDESWFKYHACVNLIQTYGRGMRAEDDYCKTYFIDNRLKEFIYDDEKRFKFIPQYFKDALDFYRKDLNEDLSSESVDLVFKKAIHLRNCNRN